MNDFRKARHILAGVQDAEAKASRDVDWKDQADVQAYHQERRAREREELIEKLTNGSFRCRCGEVIPEIVRWVVVGKTAMCRSCFAMRKNKKGRGKMMVDILVEEPRYRIDGEGLRQARQLAGLSRRKFAEKAGWHPSYQQKLESGNVITVGFEVGQTIAEVLRQAGVEVMKK